MDYSFSYGVKDLHTGDVKHQWEKKDGKTVVGHYSVLEADGSIRTVDYTADDKNGFNAVVKHKGPSYHPVQKASSHLEIKKSPVVVEHTSSSLVHQYHHQEHKSFKHDEEPPKESYLFVPSEETYEGQVQSLPVDLSLIKSDVKEAEINSVKPVEIDLTHLERQKPIELTEEQLKQFYEEYYKKNGNQNVQLEKGFRPIVSKGVGYVENKIPMPAQTFRTDKKPVTTPGLKHFSTQSGYQYGRPIGQQFAEGPVVFPRSPEGQIRNGYIKRMFRGIERYGNV